MATDSPRFYLSEEVLISPSLSKGHLRGYGVLDCGLFFKNFHSALQIFHALLLSSRGVRGDVGYDSCLRFSVDNALSPSSAFFQDFPITFEFL